MRITTLSFFGMIAGALLEALPATADPITVRLSHEAPVGHFSDVSIEFWAKRVEELSKGSVKIQVFPNGQLYSDREAVRAIARGDLDMNVSITSWLTQIEPKLIVFNLPYLFDSTDDFVRVWDSEVGRKLSASLERKNVHALGIWPTGRFAIGSVRPIRKLEDWKGLKIRVSGGKPHEVAVRALGGQAVTIPAPEVAAALETGVIQGASGAYSYWSSNFYKPLPYATVTRMWRSAFGVWANAKFWSNLPEDTRKIMEQAMREATAYEIDAVTKQEDTGAAKARAAGAEIIVLSDAEEARWKAATASVASQFPDLAEVLSKAKSD
jgi:C4-dicarboxylate-binding protein DctP